jgi:hypothetical protein
MQAATFHFHRSASTTTAAAAATPITITITIASDDITPTQPATAAQGQRPPSKKGCIERGLLCCRTAEKEFINSNNVHILNANPIATCTPHGDTQASLRMVVHMLTCLGDMEGSQASGGIHGMALF